MIHRKVIDLPNGESVALNLDDEQFSHQCIKGHIETGGLYERALSNLLIERLKPGDTFIDAGAHVGYFSLLAGKLVGPTGMVLAIEPDATNFRLLQEHLQLNRLENAFAFNCAVDIGFGNRELFVNSDNDGGHAFWDVREYRENVKTQALPQTQLKTVPTMPLSAFVHMKKPVRLIKIDTEGSEFNAVVNLLPLLKPEIVEALVFEVNTAALTAMRRPMEALFVVLPYEDYDVFVLDDNSTARTKIPLGYFLRDLNRAVNVLCDAKKKE